MKKTIGAGSVLLALVMTATVPYLMADEGDGTYVVARSIRNTQASTNASWASAFAFEIETVEDGTLKVAPTAFIYRRD